MCQFSVTNWLNNSIILVQCFKFRGLSPEVLVYCIIASAMKKLLMNSLDGAIKSIMRHLQPSGGCAAINSLSVDHWSLVFTLCWTECVATEIKYKDRYTDLWCTAKDWRGDWSFQGWFVRSYWVLIDLVHLTFYNFLHNWWVRSCILWVYLSLARHTIDSLIGLEESHLRRMRVITVMLF